VQTRSFSLAALAFLLAACGGAGEQPAPIAQAASPDQKSVAEKEFFRPSFLPAVYRFAKISTGAYLYTGSDEEAATIVKSYPDFRYEGIAFDRDPLSIGKPVYRFANLNNGGYFYTGSVEERDQVISSYPNMRYEGTTFSVANQFESFAQPVYRLANLNNGAYLFTKSAVERDYAVSLGMWRAEGTTFSAPAPVPKVYTPTAEVLAARKNDASLKFDSNKFTSRGWLIGRGCETVTNPVVYEQANTVVFAGRGVSEIDQQEVAQYAEEAALELRATYGTPPSSVGFDGVKTSICVQNESATDSVIALANSGSIVMTSASSEFAGDPLRTSKTGLISTWRDYRRTLVHEMDHVYLYSLIRANPALADVWFLEGNATFVELGKPPISKTELLNELKRQNPLDGITSGGLVPAYSGPAAVMAYLLSPAGANNPRSAIAVMSTKMMENRQLFITQCRSRQLPTETCLADPFIQSHAGFVAAFEATFKEADGTPVKLYSGPNNLHDTIAQRLERFW
jgi:hypothetical protein